MPINKFFSSFISFTFVFDSSSGPLGQAIISLLKMLRLPPTSIILSGRDVQDHLDHINEEKALKGDSLMVQNFFKRTLPIEEFHNSPLGDIEGEVAPQRAAGPRRLSKGPQETFKGIFFNALDYRSRPSSPDSDENEASLPTLVNNLDPIPSPGLSPFPSIYDMHSTGQEGYSELNTTDGLITIGVEYRIDGFRDCQALDDDVPLGISPSVPSYTFDYGGFIETQLSASTGSGMALYNRRVSSQFSADAHRVKGCCHCTTNQGR
jgi:hypothetical protein